LVSNNKISGGKILSSKMRIRKNRADQAFREAANSLWRAKNPFGDNLRNKKARSGSGSAIVATAKKIATCFYVMVIRKVEFNPYVMDTNQLSYIKNKIKTLSNALDKLNKQLAVYEQ